MATAPLIGIDCRFAVSQSGVGRYTRELTRALLERHDPWKYILFLPRDNAQIALWKSEIRNSKSEVRLIDVPYKHYSISEQLFFPRIIKKSGVTLMHFLHFNVPLFYPTPFVATIHDLILHRFPNEASLPKRIAYRFLMRNTVRKAAHLIAVSNSTAADLAATYREDIRNKTSVIHEGISEEFQPASEHEKQRVRTKYHLPPRFLLYVGAAKEHKNVQMLIDACPTDQTLILVTSGKEIAHLRLLPNVRILPNLPDSDLPALYSTAHCFVSASLAEGFNFPVLEALACGCPVVATNRGATPEIVGRFATLVEPTVEGLTKGITEVINQKLALTHARSFTWQKVVEKTAHVYQIVLNQ